MLNEEQKHLLWDINCFYQLESQKDKIVKGQPITMLPELSFIVLKLSSSIAPVNWMEKYNEINYRLQDIGLSEEWLFTLNRSMYNQLGVGIAIEEFRHKFITLMDLVINMIMSILVIADPLISKEEITVDIIGAIYDRNCWEGTALLQVNTVRTISRDLGFDKLFLIEFGKAFFQDN